MSLSDETDETQVSARTGDGDSTSDKSLESGGSGTHSTPKIVPVSLHDAALHALLASVPEISPILTHKTVATSSSILHSHETSPVTFRQPICLDPILKSPGVRRFTHKRNKSAPIQGHPYLADPALTNRQKSLDELYKAIDPSKPLNNSSTASTDEGIWTGNESAPSSEEKIDDVSSCITSCDLDEVEPSGGDDILCNEFSGVPGLVSSSTWVGVQQEQNDDSLVSVKVGSKSSHVVHFSVKAGDIITWEFATLKRDIGFGILFECSVVEERKIEDGELSDVDSITSGYGVIPILPIFKVKCDISPIFGSHEAVTDGVYVMTWDNSYSRFFAKDLYYRISTQTEISSRDFHSSMLCYPSLRDLEEEEEEREVIQGRLVIGSGSASPRTSSESSDCNELTICEEHHSNNNNNNNIVVITQNNQNETKTVYFDASQCSVQTL